jgi:methionine-S-sulfoxide reductase
MKRFILFAAALIVFGGNVMANDSKQELATFAGGCFWCTEAAYHELEGVSSVISGYTGGTRKNPTYEQVSSGVTGHAEAVQITYDPAKVNYEKLLDIYWHNIDPTTVNQQFADHGSQYRTAIFYHNEEQKRLAEETKSKLEKSDVFGGPIVTEISPASEFYPAEEYHQDYHKKNPLQYKMYKFGSGREGYLKRMWGKSTKNS